MSAMLFSARHAILSFPQLARAEMSVIRFL